jgi:electron transport complex, RnfABCDGE type, G subunit
MAKKESTLGNMLLSLVVITAVSGIVLGYIYSLTKPTIDQVEMKKNETAINAVLMTSNPVASISTDTIDGLVYNVAYDAQQQLIGAAIKTFSGKGFSGKIELMVGVLADGRINKISVLSQNETPGLGANIENEKFKSQFDGQNPASFNMKVKKDGGDVDAITAATISSRAFTEAVKRATDGFNSNLEKFAKKGETSNE